MTEEYRPATPEIAALHRQLGSAKESATAEIVTDLNDAIKRGRREALERIRGAMISEADTLRQALDCLFESQRQLQALGAIYEATLGQMTTHEGTHSILPKGAEAGDPLLVLSTAFSNIFRDDAIGRFVTSLDACQRRIK